MEKLVHAEALTQRSLYTEELLHREACTHREALHTEAFTHRSSYTVKPLHREALTQKFLHKKAFMIHRNFPRTVLTSRDTRSLENGKRFYNLLKKQTKTNPKNTIQKKKHTQHGIFSPPAR